MGYDVSFHPISPEEMQEWYFTPLTWIQQGQEEKVLALAAQHGMEDFYAEKYLNTLRIGAETESNELFDKSHGFYIAVIQGFSEIIITPEVVPFRSWWNKSQNMRGTSPHGNKSLLFPFQTPCRTESSKTIAPVYICLQIKLYNFSKTWSRTQKSLKIWRGFGAMDRLLC